MTWFRDAVEQTGLSDSHLVPGTLTGPDEEWSVEVVATDGELDSDPATASVLVFNGGPIVDQLEVSGAPAFTDEILSVVWSVSDPEEDDLEVTAQWMVDGAPTGQTGETLDGAIWFDKGDSVTFQVTVSDDYHDPLVVASPPVVILNTPPEAPVVEIVPNSPAEGVDDLVCEIVAVAYDADFDSITYEMAWELDSFPTTGTTTSWPNDTILASNTAEDQQWSCSATPFDDEGAGSPSPSDFVTIEAALPDLIVSSSYTLVDGLTEWDEVIVLAGGTLTLDGDVQIVADLFEVQSGGTVTGTGAGHSGGSLSGSGQGSGGGASSSNSGAGGGGHGGDGGDGGYDGGDSIGSGGGAYGDSSTMDIDMGSGGAGSSSATGGAGGGALTVTAEEIEVHGTITLNGADAGSMATCGADNRCAGGGAGGGVLLIGDFVTVDGSISVDGGAGGVGDDTFADSGGGGGGGRIKVFYDGVLDDSGAYYSTGGGAGGPNGGSDGGDDGGAGSFFSGWSPF